MEKDPLEVSSQCRAEDGLLTISALSAVEACTGQEVELALDVTGGQGPFQWTVSSLAPGLVLQQDGSRRALLRGALREAGSFEISLGARDARNCAQLRLPVAVAETPRITTRWPAACAGAPFELELTAEGGEPASYAWSYEGAAPLQQMGAVLSGRAPAEPGSYPVRVTLKDARCPASGAAPVVLEQEWQVRAPGECPTIVTRELPAPCAGLPYSEPLLASEGSGAGYQWSVLSGELPSGLRFDPARAVIEGTPTGATRGGALELLLTDSLGQSASARLDLSLRDVCQIAWIAEDTARLHLGDVFLSQPPLALPGELQPGARGVDLQFSPDGAWLAFRAGAAGAEQLYLQPLASLPLAAAAPGTGGGTPLSFECPGGCAVQAYAWSRDSRHLAVVLSDASGQDFVSGLSFPAPSADSPGGPAPGGPASGGPASGGPASGGPASGGPASGGPAPGGPASPAPQLWPVIGTLVSNVTEVPLDYARDLSWAPGDSFAFVGASGEDGLPEAVNLASAGLPALPRVAYPEADLRLRATPAGWIAFDAFGYTTTAVAPPRAVSLHGLAWVSPSGEYVASSFDGRLSVYAVDDAATPLASSEAGACPVVAAWAPAAAGRERILCSDGAIDAPEGGALRVFDFDVERRVLESPGGRAVPFNGVLAPGPLTNTRRFFSTSADWAVLGAPEQGVTLLHVPSGSPELPRPTAVFSVNAPAELRFSPDGRSLLIYDREGLLWSPVPPRPVFNTLSLDAGNRRLAPPALTTCEEAVWASPDNWCGAPESLGHLVISGDSKSVLFEAEGSLWLAELGLTTERPARRIAPLPRACGSSCAGTSYAFAPRSSAPQSSAPQSFAPQSFAR